MELGRLHELHTLLTDYRDDLEGDAWELADVIDALRGRVACEIGEREELEHPGHWEHADSKPNS